MNETTNFFKIYFSFFKYIFSNCQCLLNADLVYADGPSKKQSLNTPRCNKVTRTMSMSE